MGRKNGSGKPKWKAGKEMPLFSGKSWTELEDIWPKDLRIGSQAAHIIGVFFPAWVDTHRFVKSQFGFSINMREFLLLCWLQRVEEGRENVGFEGWAAMKGLNIGGRLWYARKARITKLGIVENYPLRYRLYRVTATGKTIIRYFCDAADQANMNLGEWLSTRDPESGAQLTKFLLDFALPEDK